MYKNQSLAHWEISSKNASNLLVARKTSFQSDRIMPNDDLLLAKARAAGTRNYPNKVSNFPCLGHTFSQRHKTLPYDCILYVMAIVAF